MLLTALSLPGASYLSGDIFSLFEHNMQEQRKAMKKHFQDMAELLDEEINESENEHLSTTKKAHASQPRISKKLINNDSALEYTITIPHVTKEELLIKITSIDNKTAPTLGWVATDGTEQKILQITTKPTTTDEKKTLVTKKTSRSSVMHQSTYGYTDAKGDSNLESQSIEVTNGVPLIKITLPKNVNTHRYAMNFSDNTLIISFPFIKTDPKETVLSFDKSDE